MLRTKSSFLGGMWVMVSVVLVATVGCRDSANPSDEEVDKNCPVGAEGCACTQGGGCDDGLKCYSNTCVHVPEDTASSADDTSVGDNDDGLNNGEGTAGEGAGATDEVGDETITDGDSEAGDNPNSDTETVEASDSDPGVGSDIDSEIDVESDKDGCLVGNYTIENTLDIDLIEGFSCITGDLIFDADSLGEVTLVNLAEIGGGLRIENGGIDVTFQALQMVENSITIVDSSAQFPALNKVGGEIELVRTNAVFSVLTSAPSIFVLDSSCDLPSLTSVDGDLNLEQLPSEVISGFDSLKRVNGALRIIENEDLSFLAGLQSLGAIAGGLVVRDNAVLPSLSGLDGMTSLGNGLTIQSNPNLTDISALHGVAGDLASEELDPINISIISNSALANCTICTFFERVVDQSITWSVQRNLQDDCYINAVQEGRISCDSAPITPSESLMPATNGWLDETSSGFQGRWYTETDEPDGGNSTISPEVGGAFDNNGSELCVSGVAGQVLDEQYATYWGAGFTLDLCANREDQDPPSEQYTISTCPFNHLMADQFEGIAFDISGEWGQELRVSFVEKGRLEGAYVVVSDGVSYVEALVMDADVGYDPGNPANKDEIYGIFFYVPTNASSDVNFDFCISNVRAVME